MAAGNSSSRRKSSSSHKKKHVKPSSEVRKRSRSRKRDKAKKLRRRDVSLSSSDDDSRSEDFLSVYSSDSEDDYRGRRARSRTRRDAKGTRKRARRSSSSPEDVRESPHRRKRKGSIRNGRSEAKKKTYQRKRVNARSRRGASVGSMSSDSLSCSTCRGGSSGSWESECDRPRGRSEGREKDKRNSRRSDGRSKSGYRSRSCSSCSGCSNQCSYEDDRWMGENSSRRLKSVLNVTTQSKEMEEKERNWDENRVEIIQAYDDCPSSRSNDSCDGGRKKESAYHPHIVPEKKRRIDDANKEDAYISKIRNTETGGSSKEDSRAQNDIRDPTLPMVGSTKDLTVNKNEFSAGTDITKGDDLESLLRQKALENLRKFRRVLYNNKKAPQKDEIAIEGKQSPITKAASTQNESHKADCIRLLGAGKVVASVSIPPVDRKSISPQNDGQVSDDSFKGHKSNAKLDPVCPAPNNCSPGQTVFGGKVTQTNNMIVGAINNKSAAPGNITFKQGNSGGKSILKPTSTSEESPRGKLPEIKDSADKSAAETFKTVPESGNILEDVNKDSALSAPGTCLSSTTEEHDLNEAQDEVKEGSQFEKKTMSVMHGGEMVQVSYKVYIPKKTPALARRHLQR